MKPSKPPTLSAEDVVVNAVARRHGIDVSDRGVIRALRDAYRLGRAERNGTEEES